ncbi:hypothetical protein Taro_019233 [Colocasia esculenta]|uniref:Uncharacterized protein n=1 Tax=Colocasia esculenta TaxID=4460 RepID=A0A843UKK9_COLES|nr:hypothetical protein [Colocasia esculenta]
MLPHLILALPRGLATNTILPNNLDEQDLPPDTCLFLSFSFPPCESSCLGTVPKPTCSGTLDLALCRFSCLENYALIVQKLDPLVHRALAAASAAPDLQVTNVRNGSPANMCHIHPAASENMVTPLLPVLQQTAAGRELRGPNHHPQTVGSVRIAGVAGFPSLRRMIWELRPVHLQGTSVRFEGGSLQCVVYMTGFLALLNQSFYLSNEMVSAQREKRKEEEKEKQRWEKGMAAVSLETAHTPIVRGTRQVRQPRGRLRGSASKA